MPTLESLSHFLMMYLLLGIPAVICALCMVVIARRDKGAFRRCSHCGHSGRMHSILQHREFCYATGFLLLAGVFPGILFLLWANRRYACKDCGSVAKHLPSSQALSNY